MFCLTINYTNSACRQLQKDIINVSDQQKTDVILFTKRPPCSPYTSITEKLFASGTATCRFLLTRVSRHRILSYSNTKLRKLPPVKIDYIGWRVKHRLLRKDLIVVMILLLESLYVFRVTQEHVPKVR